MPKVLKIKEKCWKCKCSIDVYRADIRYWPDHLWVPKIQAHYRCYKCNNKTWKWAHDLPFDWQKDCPVQEKEWGSYYLPRVICSCRFHHIEEIPGQYPTSKYWKQWLKENGFEKNIDVKAHNFIERINIFLKNIIRNYLR